MPEDEKIYEVVEIATNTGKIRRGVNETTKAIEREKAKLVVIAKDVSPEVITMHLPPLCDEKKVPYVYVPSREELGSATGINVPVSALAITDEGDAKSTIEKLKKSHIVEEKQDKGTPEGEKKQVEEKKEPETPVEKPPKEGKKKEPPKEVEKKE